MVRRGTTAVPSTLKSRIALKAVARTLSPFGKVTEGMSVVESLFSGYGDNGPDQGRIRSLGNAYVEASFPKLDGIVKATIEA